MLSCSLQEDVQALRNGAAVLHLVERLGGALTSEEDTLRGDAVRHLAQVSEACRAELNEESFNTLANFFREKLTDRPCLEGGLQGCLALLSPGQDGQASKINLEGAVAIERTLMRELPISTLAKECRLICFEILHTLTQGYGDRLIAQHVRLLNDITQAIDSEKDPQCLLAAFGLMRAVVGLYSSSDAARLSLEEKAEDAADVIACYFPITFRMPPNAKHGITREILASALQETLACSPVFAPFVIPLLLDKLASSLWQAKMDAMRALEACAEAWGGAVIAPYASRLWWALKEEMTEPITPETPQDGHPPNSAIPAAACLRGIVRAELRQQRDADALEHSVAGFTASRSPILDQVLEDEMVADLPQWLAECSSAGESATAAKQFGVAGLVFTAVAGSDLNGFSTLSQRVLRPLMSQVESGEAVAEAVALSSLLAIFRGAAEGDASWRSLQSQAAEQLSSAGGTVLQQLIQKRPDGQQYWTCDLRRALTRVRLLAQLVAFPAVSVQALDREGSCNGAVALLQAVTSESCQPAVSHEAAHGLSRIAEYGHEQLYEDSVMPRLLEAVASIARLQTNGWHSTASARHSPPLACLVETAKVSPRLRSSIMRGLSKVCFSSVSSAQAAAQPAGQVFDALAEEVLPACQQPFAGEESTAAQDIVLKLLEASRGFQGGIQTELLRSMAAIATTATAGLDVGEQQPIAKALTSCFALAREKDATAAFEAPMTISCRVLLALRPGVGFVSGEACSLDTLRIILSAAIDATGDLMAEAATVAAAAMLLKWPRGGDDLPESVDEAVAVSLDDVILPSLQLRLQHEPAGRSYRARSALAWVARALAMRGHPAASRPLHTAVAFLEAASLDWAALEAEGTQAQSAGLRMDPEQEMETDDNVNEFGEAWDDTIDAAEVKAMAKVFATLLTSKDDEGLNSSTHARGRILWEQKIFLEALAALEEKLDEGESCLGSPPAPLLLALAHLAGASPPNVLTGVLPRVLPRLLAALQILQRAPLVDASGLKAALQAINQALGQDAGKALLEKRVDELIPGVLACLGFAADASVRREALISLERIQGLPYATKQQQLLVLKALKQAVDDPLRELRMAAAAVSRQWRPI